MTTRTTTSTDSHTFSKGPLWVQAIRGTEFVGWVAVQLALSGLVVRAVWASSDLVVIYTAIVPRLVLAALVWALAIGNLWLRRSRRLPPYWYVAPLIWSVLLLAVAAHVPQMLRFRLVGERALDEYLDADPAERADIVADSEIGGYRIVDIQELDGGLVVFADKVDRLRDHFKCGALIHLAAGDPNDRWPSQADDQPYHLSGGWWIYLYSTRGSPSCRVMFGDYAQALSNI